MITAQKRVARGAAYLDGLMPGWALKIKIKTLDISCQCNCIDGQLFKNMMLLNMSNKFMVNHGFGLNVSWHGALYPELQEAWLAEIRKRRVKA
jgi:hypothetical protein